MKSEQVIELFRRAGALLDGHFRYTSGRHGSAFLQAARVLQYPQYTGPLCAAIAELYAAQRIDIVVGPATGGIILAYETARHLGGQCRAAFTEKEGLGMTMKRGFSLPPGARALVVEDIITTGGSVQKTLAHLRDRGADVVAIAVLIDRSGGEARFDCPFTPLARLDLRSWPPDACDLCQAGTPVVEPDDLLG